MRSRSCLELAMLYRPGELWLTGPVNRLSSMAFTANDKEIAHEHLD
ncbi:MAG TPA: hypothetical protein VE988_10490 [Gemmataceae bacterium]|nr:hypothetical protein [Gemmataceae bacterium]